MDNPKTLDKHAYYESTKYESFKGSSRLEGIELSESPPSQSIDTIKKKYLKKKV